MRKSFSFDSVAKLYDLVMPKRKPVEFLDALDAQEGDRILEIGAGTGRIAKYYGDVTKELTLLDPSQKMLEKSRELLPHSNRIVGVVENMHFQDESFNKIVSYDSFHHWQDHNQGLTEVYRTLDKNGKFYLIEVNPTCKWGKVVKYAEKLMRMGSTFFPPHVLTEMVMDTGFKEPNFLKVGNNDMTYILVCEK